jgi:outer membrane protein with beta-barrel domain
MFRKSLGFAVVLAVAIGSFAATAFAAIAATTIQVHGGAGIPVGDFADKDKADAQTGYQFGGAVTFWMNRTWGLGVDGSYMKNTHGAEGEVIDLGGGDTYKLDEDKFTTIQVGAHAKYMLPGEGKVKCYGLLGIGLYNGKEKFTETLTLGGTPSTSSGETNFDSKLGGKLGLGASYMFNPSWGLGAEADFNMVSEDKDKAGFSSLQYAGVKGVIEYKVPMGGK